MLYGRKEVNSEDRRNVSDKKLTMMCRKYRRKKKMYELTEKVEINVVIIAMWLIL